VDLELRLPHATGDALKQRAVLESRDTHDVVFRAVEEHLARARARRVEVREVASSTRGTCRLAAQAGGVGAMRYRDLTLPKALDPACPRLPD
jgi:hypothetical protein